MRKLSLGIIAALGCAVLAVPFAGTDYAISFSIQLLIFLILAYSWNLIGGYAGYTHFGQVSFFGLGEMVVFIGILVVGLYYAWKKKALNWY